MNGIRARRLVLLTASTALAAGALSLSSSAFAAPATSHPASATSITAPADVPDPVGSNKARPIKYLTKTNPATYTKTSMTFLNENGDDNLTSGVAVSGDKQLPKTYLKTSSPALYVTPLNWR
ncbi:hypothetical protein [Streptomyces sp. NBC_01443]|uniref:hypothetical protein n=1 Tax=Streptomyces sp. NBC_01443 TaxID=2903868 RepID=UPI00225A32B7|nr:hypothetical protein [Streptomyces sp. NBC_01443]MCX4625314.1 hypothetical protein [Streptomyces sp. NBC_01443]